MAWKRLPEPALGPPPPSASAFDTRGLQGAEPLGATSALRLRELLHEGDDLRGEGLAHILLAEMAGAEDLGLDAGQPGTWLWNERPRSPWVNGQRSPQSVSSGFDQRRQTSQAASHVSRSGSSAVNGTSSGKRRAPAVYACVGKGASYAARASADGGVRQKPGITFDGQSSRTSWL